MITPSDPNQYKEDLLRYTAKSTQLIHSPQVRDNIVKMLAGPDPVQKAANVSLMVMQRVDAASRASNIEVQDAVKIFAGLDVVRTVAEVLEASTGTDLNNDLIMLTFSVLTQDYVKAEIAAHRMNQKQVGVTMARDLRKMPPKLQKEIRAYQPKMQMIARKYAHGKGMASFPPDPVQKNTKLNKEAGV